MALAVAAKSVMASKLPAAISEAGVNQLPPQAITDGTTRACFNPAMSFSDILIPYKHVGRRHISEHTSCNRQHNVR